LALAIVLGTLAGFVTGWNLSLAVVLLAFVMLNVRGKTFACAWAAAGAASWLGSQWTVGLGRLLLDETPLGGAIGALGDGVWIAMFDWDRYDLAGGACLALLLSIPAAKLAAVLARRSAAGAAPQSREAWIRPWGYLTGSLGLVAFAAAPWWLGPKLVEREMLRQLSAANGAAVEAAAVRLSLWTGELEIDDLQLVDPHRFDRDRLRIGRVSACLEPGELVRGRLKTDKLLLSQIGADVARRQAEARTQSVANRLARRTDFRSVAGQLGGPEVRPTSAELELDGYLRNWPEFRDQLAWLGRLVDGIEQLATCDGARGARSDLGRPRPRVQVAQLRADDLAYAWGLGRNAMLEISQLSSNPALTQASAKLEITAPEFSTEISAELDLRQPGGHHALRCATYDLQLADLTEPNPANQSLVVSEGKIDLQGEGWLGRDGLELQLHVEAKPLDVRVASHARLAGLEAEIWDQGLRRLGGLRVEAKLAGPWTAPVLSLDRQRFVEQFKHQLRAAGEHQLVRAVEEQLARPAAADTAAEELAANETETSDSEFCTITDGPENASPSQPVAGWHRAAEAGSAASKTVEPPQPAAPHYPKTSAPDSDPADRLLAKLSKETPLATESPAEEEETAREYRQVERTQFTRAEPKESSRRPQARSMVEERSLPGPINLVVGANDRSADDRPANDRPTSDASATAEAMAEAGAEAEDDWPEQDPVEEDDYPPLQPRRPSLWARFSSGVQDRFRRIAPLKRRSAEPELPPDLQPSEYGEEEPIDEALERRPVVRKSLIERFWR
jgi:hypothetical protein